MADKAVLDDRFARYECTNLFELADQQVAEHSATQTAEHLFLSAHKLMAAGKFAMADRCLQKALQLHCCVQPCI